jgi:hypothetical protein
MSGKTAGLLVLIFVAGFFAFAVYWSLKHPRRVIGFGPPVTAKSRVDPNKVVTARTREVEVGGQRLREVELPGGNWIDCGGDCAEALRREHLDFWQTKKEEGK